MKKKSTAKKMVLILILVLLVLAAGIYIGMSLYFTKHFYPGTKMNGVETGQMTAKEVKKQIQDNLLSYRLTIKEREGKEEIITAEQMGFQYVDEKNEVENLLKNQQPWLWLVKGFSHQNYETAVNTTHDEELIESALMNLNFFKEENQTEPKDAYVEETDSGFQVVPEVMGNKLDKEKAKQAVLDAVNGGKTELSLEEAGVYIDPQIKQDDVKLNAQAESLNRLTTAEITYDFVDSQKVIDRGVIRDFLVEGEGGGYVLDEEKVSQWVNQMALETDTFGLTHEFETSEGKTITLNGGDYGWAMDIDGTVQSLIQALNAGERETLEPVYAFTAMDRSSNDIGDTYVEISIEEQRMWCYKDGELIVDTPVVTGNSSKGWDTPKGSVWAVDAKKRNAILKGEGYESPVDYWMPFNGDVGIHDLNRTEFGGEIYKTNGSHGCVNTPFDNAKEIYEAIEIGTPVIVY